MVTSTATSEIYKEIADGKHELDLNILAKKALIVNGEALSLIFNDDALKQSFLELSDKVDVVLACRVSPK
jgi:hypothetical protein